MTDKPMKNDIDMPIGSTEEAKQTVTETSASRPLDRRMLLSAGLSSVVGSILAACSTGEVGFSDKGKKGARIGNPQDAAAGAGNGDGPTADTVVDRPLDASVPDDQTNTDSPSDDDSDKDKDKDDKDDDKKDCLAKDTKELETEKTPVAEGALVPKLKFYGTAESTLIAIHFDQYDNLAAKAKINQIIVMRENGRLLALHGFNNADINSAGKARPIIIDHQALRGEKKIRLLIQLSDKTRVKHEATVEYAAEYKGAPVVDLSMGTGGEWNPNMQSIARFGAASEGDTADQAGFDINKEYKYPLPGTGDRYLYTALSTAQFVPSTPGSLKGDVTDIMGNYLGKADEFKDILEYQVFCTYVELGDGKYLRTVLRVG